MANFLTNIWARSPLSSSFGSVELPMGSSEPLMANAGKELDVDVPAYEKCEFKIEGMTCGACVEVSVLTWPRLGRLNSFIVYRGDATTSGRDPVGQGGIAL